MPTIVIPTQAQLAQAYNNPNTLLAQHLTAQTPKSSVGSGGAVTAAGSPQVNALNNPDWISSMTEMLNQINLKAQQEANAARIPGAAGLEQKSSANIGSLLSGAIPNDVYQQLAQRSAERGVASGSPMGANSTADIMRALGLTSLDLQNQGQKLLGEAYGRNPSAPLANPQGLVTTPAEAERLRLAQQGQELNYLAHMQDLAAGRYGHGYGYGGGGSPRTGGGGFAPTTNWASGGGSSPTPTVSGWSDPGNPANPSYYNDQMFGEDLAQFYPEYLAGGTTPTVTPTPTTDYNPEPYANYYNPEGGINTGGMGQDELDWLYNVGG